MQQDDRPTPKADAARAARAARQAAALRENLGRRKQQSRARSETEAGPDDATDDDADNFAPAPPLR